MAWTSRTGNPSVSLDIDTSEIARLIGDLGSSEKDVQKAMSRALRRTASALRVRASKRVVPEIGLRKAMEFRRRLRDMRVRIDRGGGEIGIWVGLNDIGVSRFKGRAVRTPGGARFRDTEFAGAFVARYRGKRSIWKRRGAARFPVEEQKLAIQDRVQIILEDEIFPDAVDTFMKLFMADLRARSIYGVGK